MAAIFPALSTEYIKSNKSYTGWLIVTGAAFIPAFVSFIFLSKWEHLVPKNGQNPWAIFTDMTWKGMGLLYTPFFIVLLTCLYFNIEHKNNTWKHILTLPITKGSIYLNKLATLISFIILFYLLYIVIWLISGNLVGLIQPQLQLTAFSPDYKLLFSLSFHSFISSLGILAIHFWLSFRIKNMIIPIAFTVACTIILIALFQGKAQEITYFPYSYHYLTVSPPGWVQAKKFGIFPEHEIFSILYFVVFSCMSYWDFTKRFKG